MIGVVVSLFDESGNMGRPWAQAGYAVHCFDIVNADRPTEYFPSGGLIMYHEADLDAAEWPYFIKQLRPNIMFSFSPCTDTAVSGAAHFAAKLMRDPECQNVATRRAKLVECVAGDVGCPWFHEHPVSILSRTWRAADHMFHPYQYGGYLSVDDVHPRWPEYIVPRDAYPKKTCIRSGNGFVMPERKPVDVALGYSAQHRKLGGKSAKTKQIRSETPRGFALAVFEANATKHASDLF